MRTVGEFHYVHHQPDGTPYPKEECPVSGSLADGTVLVEDQTHPSTAGLGDRFTLTEEFYTFRENPRPRVQVLLRLDPSSVGTTGDYPLAWTQSYGAGRVYYNALGHFGSFGDIEAFPAP